MRGLPAIAELAAFFLEDFILKGDQSALYPGYNRADGDRLTIANGTMVTSAHLGDHHEQAILLHFMVGHAEGGAQIGTPLLTVDGVNRVVNNPHLIGIAVANVKRCGMHHDRLGHTDTAIDSATNSAMSLVTISSSLLK